MCVKKKKRRKYRVLPSVTIILIMTTVMMLCNFPLFAHALNSDSYVKVSAEQIKEGYDGLIALVPKFIVSYEYEGDSYEEYFLDYNSIIFNHKAFSNEVYVNKASPKNILYIHNFWDSYVNIILVVVNIICVVIIINNVRRLIPQYVEERFNRKVRRGAKQIIRQEKKEKSNEEETGKEVK